MTEQVTPKNKVLYKYVIPGVLVLVLLLVGFFLFKGNSKPTTDTTKSNSSVAVDLNSKPLESPKNTAKLSDKETDKLSQQMNSVLKVQRENGENKIKYNWYQGWWDVNEKLACGIEIPKMPADASIEIPKNRIQDIIPVPAKPEKKNTVEYPDYKVVVPLVYANLKDRFEVKADGTINFDKTFSDDAVDSPLQKKLKDGVILEPQAPQPGEMGNAYISGHTSNYSYVDSAFNQAFKPLESKTKVGEKFYIYDCQGRKLAFTVFESKKINALATDEAWKDYPDKRVVTLQGSILETRKDGKLYPDSRWITRGELDLEETKKINATK
jgi:hypothetical protein